MRRAKIVSSLIYKFIERFSVKGIGLIISFLLARLLAPELFGQLAILNVFITLSQTIIESGLSTALVQSREADDVDFSTVFYISMALAGLMVALLYFAAPLISAYYESPELTAPLRVYSLSLFFGAFNSIQVAKIQREMRFKQQMKCSLAATVISGALGVYLAYRGAGMWALVGYFFAQIAVYCAAMLIAMRWLPRSHFSMDSAKRLYGFGARMLASSLLTTLYNNLRPLIIGKRFSKAELGYYDRGQQLASVVSLNLDAALQSVMLPVYSENQGDPVRLREMVSRSVSLGTLIIFPVMLGMSAVAEPMVRLLLTDKWLPCVVFAELLCIGEAQVPLTSTNLVALKALGRSDIYMRQELLRRALMLVVLLVSVFCFDSLEAIAIGFVFSAWLDAGVTSLPLKRLLDYGLADELRDCWKAGLSAAVMFIAVRALGGLGLPLALGLLAQIVCGAAVYLGLCLLLRAEGLVYALKMLKGLRSGGEREGDGDGE